MINFKKSKLEEQLTAVTCRQLDLISLQIMIECQVQRDAVIAINIIYSVNVAKQQDAHAGVKKNYIKNVGGHERYEHEAT